MAEAQPTERIDYHAYLRSPEWVLKRQAAIERAEGRCQLCNTDKRLQVHHRTYERLGHEKPADLTVLCQGCHAKFHGKAIQRSALADAKRKAAIARRATTRSLMDMIRDEMKALDRDGRFETIDMVKRTRHRFRDVKLALRALEKRGEVVRLDKDGWRKPRSRLMGVDSWDARLAKRAA